jgi:hypothetical protein
MIMEDLEKAMGAAVRADEKEMRRYAEVVANSEREADTLRRRVMDEISKGELSPTERRSDGTCEKSGHGCRLEPRVNTSTRRRINGRCAPVN